jgi:hypothetical protein
MLCANCHRLRHVIMRDPNLVLSEETIKSFENYINPKPK